MILSAGFVETKTRCFLRRPGDSSSCFTVEPKPSFFIGRQTISSCFFVEKAGCSFGRSGDISSCFVATKCSFFFFYGKPDHLQLFFCGDWNQLYFRGRRTISSFFWRIENCVFLRRPGDISSCFYVFMWKPKPSFVIGSWPTSSCSCGDQNRFS